MSKTTPFKYRFIKEKTMFSEYALIEINDVCARNSQSVLNKFPEVNGPLLLTSLIKPLVDSLNNKNHRNINEHKDCLQDDKDVLWVMEVICYGLGLPLADNGQFKAIRDCVHIYCEWLCALSPSLSKDKFIPLPIQNDPNLYCQKIIGHLYNTFQPRVLGTNEVTNDLISKQALIFHHILRTLIQIAAEKDNVINAQTWESLLTFLLGINEKLLKSPTDANDIGTQIADRVISSLFEGWLLSCVNYFPTPSFWRTFQHVCINSRHCPALISQWNRVNVCLTRRLVSLLYNHQPVLQNQLRENVSFKQYNKIVESLSQDVLKQCWYRFLHIIGNPIDLCFPKIIYKKDVAKNNPALVQILPFIFHKAMKGLCTLVDIFLGIPNLNIMDLEYDFPKLLNHINHGQQTDGATPPEKRKSIKKESLTVLRNDKQSARAANILQQQQQQSSNKNLPDNCPLLSIVLPILPGNFYQNHLKLTSILDIFGKWLFQASFINITGISEELLEKSLSNQEQSSFSVVAGGKLDHSGSSQEFEDFSLDWFEAGQAEALGALCRIFCLKKDDEDVSLILSKQNHPEFAKLKNYLTSYYLALKFNVNTLHANNDQHCRIQILSSILVNSATFFEVDLPGSKILIPHFLRCIEYFLMRKDKIDSQRFVLIRKACIKILISLLSYPLYFKNLPIKDNLSEQSCNTFMSFYPKLILLLIFGLYNEPDQNNIQMILNAFLYIVEDCVHNDNVGLVVAQDTTDSSSSPPINLNLNNEFSPHHRAFQWANEHPITGKLDRNLFLLITSFVSDVLLKKNSNCNISLTAIEILLALGRVKYRKQLLCNEKCSLCIRQICRFIEIQCYKPAMYHSKDMHSTIVAAYQCLSVWIHEHDHLIKDKDCIMLLFELIELGISGSKSHKDNGVEYKSEKMIKPASLRVREAAELLLSTMMSKIETFNARFDEYIIPCQLNEAKIIEHLFNIHSNEYCFNQFRYFVVENALLISILDKPAAHGETVCIVRSAYGKYCFIMKHQSLPNHRQAASNVAATEVTVHRSLNKPEPVQRNISYCYFPEHYDKICNTKYDLNNMIPSLTKYINSNEDIRNDYERMVQFLAQVESNLNLEKAKLPLLNNHGRKDIIEPPAASKTFEAYRLILSQFEIFNLDFKNTNNKTSRLLALNNSSQDFIEHLGKLDLISSKQNDLVMLFYVPKDFIDEREILNASNQQFMANTLFRYFLQSLGTTISCETDICSNIFYWKDILHELIFISPVKLAQESTGDRLLTRLIRESNENIRNMFLRRPEVDQKRPNDRINDFLFGNSGCDIKVFVLWLEKMEDFDRTPFKNCLVDPDNGVESEKYFFIIIHPLRNGLFRVVNYFSSSKSINFLPIDRMLLSKQLLASYVRLTALNLFRRRRMNAESFQLPHVRRRLKIQELANKFKSSTNDKLLTELFNSKFL